jgi:ubiquinone biosynthesis protein COQ9
MPLLLVEYGWLIDLIREIEESVPSAGWEERAVARWRRDLGRASSTASSVAH